VTSFFPHQSVRLDNWKAAEVEVMVSKGNSKSSALYLARLQQYKDIYAFPKSGDGAIIREQWVRSKYERKEWMDGGVTLSNQLRILEYAVPVRECLSSC
jgi:hypothetical protein